MGFESTEARDRARYWLAYVRLLADEMGLSDWSFEIEVEPAPDEVSACIRCVPGRRYAIIRLSSTWEKKLPEEQRNGVAHELIHAHLARANDLADSEGALPTLLGRPAWTAFYQGFELALEDGVDALATVIARNLPLPPDELENDPNDKVRDQPGPTYEGAPSA